MTTPFTIDIWSDLVCPFCYLGEAQLNLALSQFTQRNEVVLRFRAFELDAATPKSVDRSLAELVAHKYNMALEEAIKFHHRLEAEAASYGLEWHFDQARVGNTFDGHRLVALAADQGLGTAMTNRLFRAYFSEGQLLSDHATLRALADEVGVRGAAQMLGTDAYADEVRADEADALELGITGVPAMLIDGRFLVAGARPPHELLEVLERAWARRAVVG
jgi:predicted DsbA family dithiol-disulfide isomerase